MVSLSCQMINHIHNGIAVKISWSLTTLLCKHNVSLYLYWKGSDNVVNIGLEKNLCTDDGYTELTGMQCLGYIVENNEPSGFFKGNQNNPTGCFSILNTSGRVMYYNKHSTGGTNSGRKYCKCKFFFQTRLYEVWISPYSFTHSLYMSIILDYCMISTATL